MYTEPDSVAKLTLIQEFLRLTGGQDDVNLGRMLNRFWLPGGDVFAASPPGTNPTTAMERARSALESAYDRHREGFQHAYENQVDREFNQDELRQINAFLRTAAGQHYRDAIRRLTPYAATAALVRKVVEDACAAVWDEASKWSAG